MSSETSDICPQFCWKKQIALYYIYGPEITIVLKSREKYITFYFKHEPEITG